MPPKRKVPKKVREGLKAAKRVRDPLDAVIASINKELKEGGSVGRGADISYMTWERIPSGSLGLDMIMGGGLPRGGLVQYKGEESSSKTSMALASCALSQSRGEPVAWSAAEGFDKAWARKWGCFIPYSEAELDLFVQKKVFRSMADARTRAEQYFEAFDGYADFFLAQAKSGPRLLEVTARLQSTGQFGIVVVDSIGAIIPDEADEKDIGEENRVGGNCKVVKQWVNKTRRAFNTIVPGDNGDTIHNKTCVIAINQMMAQIGVYAPRGTRPPPEAGGGYALKHGKDIDIRFNRGELLQESIDGRKLVYGRVIKAKADKNKTAPPYRETSWEFYFKDHPSEKHVKAGSIDQVSEVFHWGVYYGLIEQAGAWYKINGVKHQGAEPAISALREDPDVVAEMYQTLVDMAAKQ